MSNHHIQHARLDTGDVRIPKTPFRLVVVQWVDSQQPLIGWQWIDELPPAEAVECVSVGFLIEEGGTALSLAASLGDVGKERSQALGVVCIPMNSVKSIVDINFLQAST